MTRERNGILMSGLAAWAVGVGTIVLVELALHLLGVTDYQRLVVDAADLSDDIRGLDAGVSTIGIGLLAAASAVAGFAGTARWCRPDLRSPLLALALLAGALALDDGLRGHEELSDLTRLPESVVLLAYPAVAGWIVVRWGRLLLPERGWALLALGGFGTSFALDAVIEELLDLSLPGVAFVEENAKLAGIAALLALVVQVSRRALTPPARDEAGPG